MWSFAVENLNEDVKSTGVLVGALTEPECVFNEVCTVTTRIFKGFHRLSSCTVMAIQMLEHDMNPRYAQAVAISHSVFSLKLPTWVYIMYRGNSYM